MAHRRRSCSLPIWGKKSSHMKSPLSGHAGALRELVSDWTACVDFCMEVLWSNASYKLINIINWHNLEWSDNQRATPNL